MNTLRHLLVKEYKQIFRNPVILQLIVIIPIIQLVILPQAADYEMKNIRIAVVDQDLSSASRRLTADITSSGFFLPVYHGPSAPEAMALMEIDQADIILEIPPGFDRDLVRAREADLRVAVNAINGTKGLLGGAYLQQIITSFNANIVMDLADGRQGRLPRGLIAEPQFWYNPSMNYKFLMVPGILVMLVTLIAMSMCALNIVKEKETGTIEQINVTPIPKAVFILGKLIPFWTLGLFVFTLGFFGVARIIYHIVPVGSVWLLYGFLALFLFAALGMGLLISTFAETQQQAMSISFFVLIITLLMSGLFTSVESMPRWAQGISYANPVTYFIDVMRMVVLKGSGWADIRQHVLIVAGFAVFFNTWAILNYRKTV